MAICECGAYVECDEHETLPYCDECSHVVEETYRD